MRRTSIECCSNMGNGFADGGCLSEEVSSSGRGVGRQDYFACGITTTTGPGRREQDGFRGHEGTGMEEKEKEVFFMYEYANGVTLLLGKDLFVWI